MRLVVGWVDEQIAGTTPTLTRQLHRAKVHVPRRRVIDEAVEIHRVRLLCNEPSARYHTVLLASLRPRQLASKRLQFLPVCPAVAR